MSLFTLDLLSLNWIFFGNESSVEYTMSLFKKLSFLKVHYVRRNQVGRYIPPLISHMISEDVSMYLNNVSSPPDFFLKSPVDRRRLVG